MFILPMITAQSLKNDFARNTRLIHRAIDGLTHEDSLITAPYFVNSINWTLGHILNNRNVVLRIAGAQPAFDPQKAEFYKTDSQTINAQCADVVKLEALVAVLDEGMAMLSAQLDALSDEEVNAEFELPFGRRPRIDGLHFFFFHDTYHLGELAVLRQLTGKSFKVV
jgi:uncharacterized damage-inducible protein DinB